MALSILALCLFIFGAYAYGSVVVLTLRHRSPIWSSSTAAASPFDIRLPGLAMYIVCTLWFILHTIIEFRFLLGEPREDDFFDLAVLELAFIFPGLIFHTVLLETSADDDRPRAPGRAARALRTTLYGAGVLLATYWTAAIFDRVPAPQPLGPFIGFSIGALFTACSVGSVWLMARRGPSATATPDERRQRASIMALFGLMIALFFVLTLMRGYALLIDVVAVLVRSIPLAFLLVSVYFENRTEFYDLVIKRGVIMLLSLLILASALGLMLGWLEQMPENMARPWLFAAALLPFAMILPWLHHRVGQLLDRLWFGRDYTPVEAVKHVLGAMQQATDEPSLIAATEATLSEMFRRRVTILFEHPTPLAPGMVATEIAIPGAAPVRLAIVNEPGARPVLSEDLALLRSLGSVFGFMLENVRLQRKRREQEQLAQELRLQTSRSELKALRAQINPHFLFNALNAIASLIHTDPVRADAAVEQLAEVFRYTLRRSAEEWTTLDQELAFARAYLDVEQARFGRRLAFSIDADPALASAHVPSMLLQTLVENAVKHGISRLRHQGHIAISARAAGGELTLEVRDTGPGLEAANHARPAAGESFGLRSVRDRLEGHFGARAALAIFRDEAAGQTVARITLPLVTDERAVAALPR